MKWQPISTVPCDNDIEVCVIEGEPHVFASACRLTEAGWIEARTKRLLDIRPTHWRQLQPSAGYLTAESYVRLLPKIIGE